MKDMKAKWQEHERKWMQHERRWKEMKTTDDICWLSTKDAFTPTESWKITLLVYRELTTWGNDKSKKCFKKNDDVILGHLKRYRVFVQSHMQSYWHSIIWILVQFHPVSTYTGILSVNLGVWFLGDGRSSVAEGWGQKRWVEATEWGGKPGWNTGVGRWGCGVRLGAG